MAFGGETVQSSIFYRGRATDQIVRYLSNWHRLNQPILFRTRYFPTTEHLYKWTKAKFFNDSRSAEEIMSIERRPDQLSQMCTYREPQHRALNKKWNDLKEEIMIKITEIKFGSDSGLRQLLIGTGDCQLIEDTNDECWGRGRDGSGSNLHGKCLMRVRDFYRFSATSPSTLLVGDSLVRNIELPDCKTICMGGAHAGQVCLIAELFVQLGVTNLVLHVGTNDCFPRPTEHLHGHDFRFGHSRHQLLTLIQMICGICRRNRSLSVAVSPIISRPCDISHISDELVQMRIDLNELLISKIIEEQKHNQFQNLRVFDHRWLLDLNSAEKCFDDKDLLHLNAEGKKVFRGFLVSALYQMQLFPTYIVLDGKIIMPQSTE